jgi:hypothetical protein
VRAAGIAGGQEVKVGRLAEGKPARAEARHVAA